MHACASKHLCELSSNNRPSATANEATHSFTIGGGVTKPTETYIFDKVESGAADGRFGKQFFIRDAYNLDNKF